MNNINVLRALAGLPDLSVVTHDLVEASFTPAVEDLMTGTVRGFDDRDVVLSMALKARAVPALASAADSIESISGLERKIMKGRSTRDVAFGLRLSAAALAVHLRQDT